MSISRKVSVLGVAVLIIVSVASAQEVSYTKFLLPVSPSTVEGANGAVWRTELTLTNAGFSNIELFCFVGTCAPLPARSLQRVDAPLTTAVRPGLFYVPTADSRRLFAALRSRNSTPNSDERDFVSEIPVVRESEFRSSIIEISAIPIEPDYRHMLRVYDAKATEGTTVRVRIYGITAGTMSSEPVVDRELVLNTSRGTASPYALPDEPSWAMLPDFGDLPGVRNFNEVHVRVENLVDNLELWAFVTATSNRTQRFAVYTP